MLRVDPRETSVDAAAVDPAASRPGAPPRNTWLIRDHESIPRCEGLIHVLSARALLRQGARVFMNRSWASQQRDSRTKCAGPVSAKPDGPEVTTCMCNVTP